MKKLLFFLAVFSALSLNAQYFQTGQDPASIKWRQINTTNFQLIYPDYYENQAQQLAQKLEAVYDLGSHSMQFKPQKISVILHTQTVRSNGLVAYAPKRSEFYTTPHQAIYPQDWLEQLAIHEFRHVVQIDKVNKELPKLIKILLGEQGTALFFGAYMPWWFIEGDAVVAETALGKFGRGRLPSFLIEHKAQVVEKGVYNYDKAYLGSYKDYVPNHYQLGYYLVGNTRERYGTELWEKTVKRVGDKPLSFTPFNKALKLQTGMGKVDLYRSVFDSLAIEWASEDAAYKYRELDVISVQNKTYTNYTYNHYLNSGDIVSYRTALNKIPAIIKHSPDGKEEKIFRPGFIFDESLSYREEWVVWSEQIPDVRWSHSGRSRICLYNLENSRQIKFLPEFKAFAPSLSHDLNKVAVVETDFSSNYYLSVYNVMDGSLLHRIQTPDNNYFFSPEWINEEELVVILLTTDGKKLAKFDLETGASEMLIDKNLGNIKQLRYRNGQIYFIGAYSGKDALYALNLTDNSIVQLYEPRFGVGYPAIQANGDITVSDYTADGYRVIQPTEIQEKKIENVEEEKYLLAQRLAAQENGVADFRTDQDMVYASEQYKKGANLFNFHSWAPIFIDPYRYEFYPGISLMSQNKLGTSETVLGYKWDTSEDAGQFYGSYTYKGWYPVFRFEFSRGKRQSSYWLITQQTNPDGEVIDQDTTLESFSWKETEFKANIHLPLNFSQGSFYRLFQPEFNYELTNYKGNESAPDKFPAGSYHSLMYRLYYHQLMRQSQQDVYPNFGFVLDGTYKHSPSGTKGLGSLLAGQSYLYLPGILANHGIRTYAAYQEKNPGETFRMSDAVRFPRGWNKIETEKLSTLAIDYKMPLLNPDWSLGGLAYFRRISATLFADFANIQGTIYENGEASGTYKTNISSYGVECIGDLNFFRFYAPVKIGVRASHLPEINDFVFDLLFSVDFTSL